MPKNEKVPKVWLSPTPGGLGEQLARALIDAPDSALKRDEADAVVMESALSEPGVREEIKRTTPGLGWVAPLLRQRAAWLKAGRDEAHEIMALLDQAALGELKRRLRAQPPSIECVIWLLHENRRLSASRAASRAASGKNADARAYVADVWSKRVDKGQSRASFARMMVPEVKRHFDVAVTPDRIARHWLPK